MPEYELVKAPHWSKYDYYLRKRRDRRIPTRNELMARLRFAEAAMRSYGKKKTGPLPPAAESVKETLPNLPPLPSKKLKKYQEYVAWMLSGRRVF